LILVVPASSSATLESLMKRATEQPGTVTYGSIGAGSPQHLAGELLANGARTSLVHVPYKGSGPLVQDTLGGVVDIGISSLPPAINLIKAGKLRALAVTSATRVPSLPDVPTMQELGYQGYEFNTWVGVAVPLGTPADIILKINQSLRTALASDEIKKIFLDQGAEPVGSTPAFFKTFILNEIAKSAEIVSKAKISLE
jgi:tripartite-type tricarboxylate transporter receptor subunit TctC